MMSSDKAASRTHLEPSGDSISPDVRRLRCIVSANNRLSRKPFAWLTYSATVVVCDGGQTKRFR